MKKTSELSKLFCFSFGTGTFLVYENQVFEEKHDLRMRREVTICLIDSSRSLKSISIYKYMYESRFGAFGSIGSSARLSDLEEKRYSYVVINYLAE